MYSPILDIPNETIEALKTKLASTNKSLVSMQKAKDRVLHSRLQCEAKEAAETAEKVIVNPMAACRHYLIHHLTVTGVRGRW